MLKQYVLALMMAGLVYTVPSAVAQNSPNSDPSAGQSTTAPEHRRGHDFDPAKRTAKLSRKLKLTSDQQAKVQDILSSQKSQFESLKSDSTVAGADRHSKVMEIRKASADQIRAVLDPNQQKKWDAMQAKREQRESRHSGQGTGAPSAS